MTPIEKIDPTLFRQDQLAHLLRYIDEQIRRRREHNDMDLPPEQTIALRAELRLLKVVRSQLDPAAPSLDGPHQDPYL